VQQEPTTADVIEMPNEMEMHRPWMLQLLRPQRRLVNSAIPVLGQ
jgi:hypothetical protein